MVRLIVLLIALLWVQLPAVANTDAALDQSGGQVGDDPVSAGRIRDGLRRPELQIPELPPPPLTFRVEVEERLETPLDVIRRELREEASLNWRPPVTKGLYEVDLLPALTGLVNRIKTIRRQHAEADARAMVRRELAEFCATHDCSSLEGGPVSEGVILSQ